jgi:hypothetical protein
VAGGPIIFRWHNHPLGFILREYVALNNKVERQQLIYLLHPNLSKSTTSTSSRDRQIRVTAAKLHGVRVCQMSEDFYVE